MDLARAFMSTKIAKEFQGTERFLIERRLGAGGMGVVYLAYDRQRNDRVALKTFRHLDPAAIYHIKREFRTLADVTHPNLVSLYELISEGEQCFFTMQLVDGVDFLSYVSGFGPRAGAITQRPSISSPGGGAETATYVPSSESDNDTTLTYLDAPARFHGSPLKLDRLRGALAQLVEGVCALHRAGKLHRDIKPSNVLVTSDQRVVLLDFGLATELAGQEDETSVLHGVVGTAFYMSPEQAAGLPATGASDWYCVGVMLYQALTGRLPFAGSKGGVLWDKQVSDPPSPSELAPGVPEDLNALCVDLLCRDPGGRPTDEQVRRRVCISPGESAESAEKFARREAPFVGRRQHLEALGDAFASLNRGRTTVVFVHGRSGMGKSVLVERFLESLRHEEAVVLTGRCYEQESVPYKALDSLIDALSHYLLRLSDVQVEALLPRDAASLARVFPVLRRVEAVAQAPRRTFETPDQQELRRRALAALRELLVRLGDRKPLVLSIDDLQWGDVDSANLIAELLRPPDPPLLLLLGCYRSEYADTSPCLKVLLQQPDKAPRQVDRRELAVEPLAPGEACSLALALLGQVGPAAQAAAESIARESRGNPYFIYELVRYVQAGANLAEHSSSVQGPTLERVLWDRIHKLPGEAYRLLEVVAVASQPLKQADAYRAARLAPAERTALSVLRAEHLVRSTGLGENDEVETYHDRIRETVVDHLPAGGLKDCHARLAVALEASSNADPEALAIHLQAAGEEARAGHYYAIAADRAAAALAFVRAAKLYRLALELQTTNDQISRSLRTRLGDALANAGRGAEAAYEYLAAAAGAPAAEALELQRRAGMQSLISGHIDHGLQALGTVLDSVGLKLARTPRRALWSLLWRRAQLRLRGLGFRERDSSQVSAESLTRIDICWSAAVGLSIVDTIRGADFQARNLLLSLRTGEPYRIARALAWEAAHTSTGGVPARRTTARLIAAADALAQRIGHPHALGLVMLSRGIAGYMEGRWKDGRKFSEQAEAIFRDRCTGVAWELDTAHSFSNWSLFFLGEVAELTRRLPLLLQEARERGDLYAATNLGTFVGHLTWLAADDPQGAERDMHAVMALWSHQGFHVQHLTGLMGRIQIALYRGDGAAAWRIISREWQDLKRSLFLRVQTVRLFMRDLRARSALAAAREAADPRPLLRAARRDARRIEREHLPWSQPLAERIGAALAAAGGDEFEAAELLKRAAAGFEAADMGLFAAAARRRQGQILGGEQGSSLIAQADGWMERQQIGNPRRMTAMYMPGFAD
jgi:serine/threonine protein kinase